MAESSRLTAHRVAALSAGEPDAAQVPDPAPQPEEEDSPDNSNPKESSMTQEEIDKAIADAAAAATATANQRYSAVLASEHYAGREQLAQTLLGNDKMTAEDIIAALEKAPAPAPATAAAPALSEEQQAAAAEAGGRKAMKEALAETANSAIDAGTAPKPDDRARADAVWAKAYGLDTATK